MSNITVSFIIVVMLNVFMMLSSQAIYELNAEATFYDGSNSLIDNYNVTARVTDPGQDLPVDDASVESRSGDVYTDIFGSMLGFVKSNNIFTRILSAPYNYLILMGLPASFVIIIGTAWYLITLVLLILVLFGRQS